jgi:hypothetical protein
MLRSGLMRLLVVHRSTTSNPALCERLMRSRQLGVVCQIGVNSAGFVLPRTLGRPDLFLIFADRLSQHMPLRQEAQFLRERARRLREIAGTYRTALSERLRDIAEELEGRADELERTDPSAD